MDDHSSHPPVRIPVSQHQIDANLVSDSAWRVLKGLIKAGYSGYLVGGAVRDLLIGRHPKDFDISTDATPEQVRKVFRNARLIGRRFKIVHVRYGREIIEVATFRASHEQAERRGDAQSDGGRLVRDNVYGTLETDVWRRDFTANALYYDGADQSIVDFVGGIDDVHAKVLKIIGPPETRFQEDPVRILRAIRFAGKLDFSMDSAFEPLLKTHGKLLKDGSPARLFDEMLKLFHAGAALKTFELLRQYDVFRYFFPSAAEQFEREQDGLFLALVRAALTSTDRRIRQGKPVTPAFLVAIMLWNDVRYFAEQSIEKKVPVVQSWLNASQRVVSNQSRHLSIPRRFSLASKEIWMLQNRFSIRRGKRALAVLTHQRFRAAYDVLCLRHESGEPGLGELVTFWTDIQELPEPEQLKLLQVKERRVEHRSSDEDKPKPKPRRRRRRKKPSKGSD